MIEEIKAYKLSDGRIVEDLLLADKLEQEIHALAELTRLSSLYLMEIRYEEDMAQTLLANKELFIKALTF